MESFQYTRHGLHDGEQSKQKGQKSLLSWSSRKYCFTYSLFSSYLLPCCPGIVLFKADTDFKIVKFKCHFLVSLTSLQHLTLLTAIYSKAKTLSYLLFMHSLENSEECFGPSRYPIHFNR